MTDFRIDLEIEIDDDDQDGVDTIQTMFEEFVARSNWALINVDVEAIE